MTEVEFSFSAFSKIILHAAKYPHCAINGLLLAEQDGKSDRKSSRLIITDAIPLFHLCLHVSPMAELALTLVDQYAAQNGLVIAGYYLANELINDMSTDKPAHRIADKIAEHYSNATLVVIDNKEISFVMENPPLRVFHQSEGKWKPTEKTDIIVDADVLDEVNVLMKDEKYRNLVDFDNHLDNISLNWLNPDLNKNIEDM